MNVEAIRNTERPVSYVRYGVVLGLIAVIRVAEFGMSGLLENSSNWLSLGLVLLAIVASVLTARTSRRYFPPAMVVLLCVLAGGVSTMLVSSIPGMFIGLLTGLVMSFTWPRLFAIALAQTFFPGTLFGIAFGFVGAFTTFIRVRPEHRDGAAIVICVTLFVVALLMGWLAAKKKTRRRRLTFVFAALMFLMLSTLAVPFGVQLDTARRLRAMKAFGADVWTQPQWRTPKEYLTSGFSAPRYFNFNQGLTKRQAKYLVGFHELESVHFGNDASEIDPAALRMLDLSDVVYVVGYEGNIDDDVLTAFADSPNVVHVDVQRSKQITDDGLRALSNMSWLGYLNLTGANVDGSGLRHLPPQVPLVVLNLAETNVTDETIERFLRAQPLSTLSQLDLSQTKITGRSLERLNAAGVTTGLRMLNVSNSNFEERYLETIPLVGDLRMDGVPLTSNEVQSLLCRYQDAGAIQRLWISQSGIDDVATGMLRHLDISFLNIDATRLTTKSCPAFVYVEELQLQYEMDQWLASGKSIDDLVATFTDIRDTTLQLHSELSEFDRRRPLSIEINLVIRGLHITFDVYKSLERLPACQLVDVTIEGHDDLERRSFDIVELPLYFRDDILSDVDLELGE